MPGSERSLWTVTQSVKRKGSNSLATKRYALIRNLTVNSHTARYWSVAFNMYCTLTAWLPLSPILLPLVPLLLPPVDISGTGKPLGGTAAMQCAIEWQLMYCNDILV